MKRIYKNDRNIRKIISVIVKIQTIRGENFANDTPFMVLKDAKKLSIAKNRIFDKQLETRF